MQFIRRSALALCISLLFSSLFLFGLVFGLFRVFGTSEPIKHALKNSGIYQTIVNDALQQAQKGQQSGGEDKLPLDRPEVQNIVKTAASPELLQTKTEQALDDVYAWVQGKTPGLELKVEVADIKTNLASGVEQYVSSHVASLPVCAPGASGNIEDPFNATCRPQGVDSNQVATEAKNQIQNGEFLKETTFDAANQKGSNGQTPEQSLRQVPEVYQKAKWAPLGLGVLTALLLVAVVFLSLHWRAGLKKASMIFMVVGAISMLAGWLSAVGMDRASQLAKEPLQQSGFKVAQLLVNDYRTWWMIYGFILLAIGLATFITLRLTKQKLIEELERKVTAMPDEAPASSERPQETVAPKPKPRPPKKLVQ